jgi:hypothetical protein
MQRVSCVGGRDSRPAEPPHAARTRQISTAATTAAIRLLIAAMIALYVQGGKDTATSNFEAGCGRALLRCLSRAGSAGFCGAEVGNTASVRASTVVALFAGIAAIGSEFVFASISAEPVPRGPEVLLARGVAARIPWTLTAQQSNMGLCVHVNYGPGQSGGCGSGVRGESPASTGRHFISPGVGHAVQQRVSFLTGIVAARVARVQLRLRTRTLDVPVIIAAPPSLKTNVGFYIVVAKGRIALKAAVAYDVRGRVLENRQLLLS